MLLDKQILIDMHMHMHMHMRMSKIDNIKMHQLCGYTQLYKS
jgi:hypothetical protein